MLADATGSFLSAVSEQLAALSGKPADGFMADAANELRAERGMPVIETSHHLVFTGNPGTELTTLTTDDIAPVEA